MALASLKKHLEEQEFFVETLDKTAELGFAHLKVGLGLDAKGRELSALMWFFTKADEQPVGKLNSPDSLFLQIIVMLPFSFLPETLLSCARFVLMVNKVAVFPGFGLSEPDLSLYYKYTLCFGTRQPDEKLIADFIGAVQFLCDVHTPHLEEIASGKKTFDQIIS